MTHIKLITSCRRALFFIIGLLLAGTTVRAGHAGIGPWRISVAVADSIADGEAAAVAADGVAADTSVVVAAETDAAEPATATTDRQAENERKRLLKDIEKMRDKLAKRQAKNKALLQRIAALRAAVDSIRFRADTLTHADSLLFERLHELKKQHEAMLAVRNSHVAAIDTAANPLFAQAFAEVDTLRAAQLAAVCRLTPADTACFELAARLDTLVSSKQLYDRLAADPATADFATLRPQIVAIGEAQTAELAALDDLHNRYVKGREALTKYIAAVLADKDIILNRNEGMPDNNPAVLEHRRKTDADFSALETDCRNAVADLPALRKDLDDFIRQLGTKKETDVEKRYRQ